MIAGCVDLLRGGDADPELVFAVGGPPATWVLQGGEGGPAYWLRVWGARGLLYAFDETAVVAVTVALDDEHRRVREMAAKACGRHRIESAVPRLAAMSSDSTLRVRRASEKALERITRSA